MYTFYFLWVLFFHMLQELRVQFMGRTNQGWELLHSLALYNVHVQCMFLYMHMHIAIAVVLRIIFNSFYSLKAASKVIFL